MNRDLILNEYFNWLSNIVGEKRYSNGFAYSKLLMRLHSTPFRYSIPNDRSRAEDGIELRFRFAITQGYEDSSRMICDILGGPCSVLEMLVALSLHCEEWMDDPEKGNRTGQWFWGMIANLGLGSMYDSRFDKRLVDDIIDKFLDRNYEPNGEGGLFRVHNPPRDLRYVEIWVQLCWYLGSIT